MQPDTVRFYLKAPQQKVDYQLQQDGTIKMQYYGIKHRLVLGVMVLWLSGVAFSADVLRMRHYTFSYT